MMQELKAKYNLKDGDQLHVEGRFYNPYTICGDALLNDMGNHSQHTLYQIYHTGRFKVL